MRCRLGNEHRKFSIEGVYILFKKIIIGILLFVIISAIPVVIAGILGGLAVLGD